MAKSNYRFLNGIFDKKQQVKLSCVLYERDKQHMVQVPKQASERVLEQRAAAPGNPPCLVTLTASVVSSSQARYCQYRL